MSEEFQSPAALPFCITSATRVLGVIGHPIRHSLSPVIHNAGFRSTGADFVYVAFDVPPGRAQFALDAVRNLDLAGLSVTMPHKADVARAVDVLGESARHLESVNTVEVSGSGSLIGHSTDGDGLVASLLEHDTNVEEQIVTVFGAGGAGRSVVDALARHGAGRIQIVNRSVPAADRAAELCRGYAVPAGDQQAVQSAVRESHIVINATSVGMNDEQGSIRLFDPEFLSKDAVVVDLVYHPIRTRLLKAAAERGCRTVDGLGMLVHQAALQQAIWTGMHPDVAEMRSAAIQALQQGEVA